MLLSVVSRQRMINGYFSWHLFSARSHTLTSDWWPMCSTDIIPMDGRRQSFAGWVKSRFKDRSKECQHLSKAADARALVLDIAKNDLDGIWAERAAAGAAYYRTVVLGPQSTKSALCVSEIQRATERPSRNCRNEWLFRYFGPSA